MTSHYPKEIALPTCETNAHNFLHFPSCGLWNNLVLAVHLQRISTVQSQQRSVDAKAAFGSFSKRVKSRQHEYISLNNACPEFCLGLHPFF